MFRTLFYECLFSLLTILADFIHLHAWIILAGPMISQEGKRLGVSTEANLYTRAISTH